MIELIIITLAVYGLTNLIVYQDGPYDIFVKLRKKYKNSAFHCVICLSVWVAVLSLILFYFSLSWLLLPFSIVGAVILLEKL